MNSPHIIFNILLEQNTELMTDLTTTKNDLKRIMEKLEDILTPGQMKRLLNCEKRTHWTS